MRFRFSLPTLLLLVAATALSAAPLPPEYETILKAFRAEGAKGWAFTQTTSGASHSLVERFEPLKPEFHRWTLLKKDGRDPTEKELKEYQEKQTRRTSGDTAPDVTKQLDLESAERVSDDNERAAYRFRLKPGDKEDTSAAFMQVTFTFNKPTKAIERVELASTGEFSPMFAVKIREARTVMLYSLPEGDRPSLLDRITVRVRGRAMWIKSLDEDMQVVYSDYHYVAKKPATSTVQPTSNAESPVGSK